MATKKKIDNQKYIDIKNWVEKIINSCVTHKQTLTAGKLIDNFYNMMTSDNVDIMFRCNLEYILRSRLYTVQSELYGKN